VVGCGIMIRLVIVRRLSLASFGCVCEKNKGEDIVGGEVPTTWCGSLLWLRIVAEASCGLGPFFFWIL
jgi:hypothetical protein